MKATISIDLGGLRYDRADIRRCIRAAMNYFEVRRPLKMKFRVMPRRERIELDIRRGNVLIGPEHITSGIRLNDWVWLIGHFVAGQVGREVRGGWTHDVKLPEMLPFKPDAPVVKKSREEAYAERYAQMQDKKRKAIARAQAGLVKAERALARAKKRLAKARAAEKSYERHAAKYKEDIDFVARVRAKAKRLASGMSSDSLAEPPVTGERDESHEDESTGSGD